MTPLQSDPANYGPCVSQHDMSGLGIMRVQTEAN